MLTINSELLKHIESVIDDVEREYQSNQGLILTEDDLKCILYMRLSQLPQFQEYKITQDQNIRANMIHSEVSWYNSDGKLGIKPDLTILEPENLSILKGLGNRIKLPSKQFNFKGNAIIFELKFARLQSGITESYFTKKIKKDFDKIKKLFSRLKQERKGESVYCFFLIFSKVNKMCESFSLFYEQNSKNSRHKIIFKTGNVKFN